MASDPQQFCAIMNEWADLYSAKDETFCRAWSVVRMAIRKSSLLRRRLYGGEALRTEQCPLHKGEWSGLVWDRPEGCACYDGGEVTGWVKVEGSDA